MRSESASVHVHRTNGAARVQQASDGDLTPREIEIMRILANGMTAVEVAQMLGIQLNTVRWHLKIVHQKLGSSTMVEAAVICCRRGLLG